jgi:spore germination protein GerM
MSPTKAAAALALVLLVIVGAIALWGERPTGISRPAAPRMASEPAKSPVRGPKKTVVLYFAGQGQKLLQEETREIIGGTTMTEDAKRTLEELVKGPEGDLTRTLPKAVRLRNLFIESSGTAYADFDRELMEARRGDAREELCAVFSIVDTLAANFPQIKRVQILVEGAEIPTLAGSIDTRMPLSPQYVF